MKQSKLSIPSQDRRRIVMTLVILKIHLVSIYEPTTPSNWRAKNETCENCITCVAHHTKGFLVFIGHTHNCRNICNSFFNVDMMASSIKTICPKRQSSSSSVVGMLLPS